MRQLESLWNQLSCNYICWRYIVICGYQTNHSKWKLCNRELYNRIRGRLPWTQFTPMCEVMIFTKWLHSYSWYLSNISLWRDKYHDIAWWRHQMETFSALLAICAGNTPVTGEFPAQMTVTRSFGVFFHLCLNKRFSKRIVRLVIWDAIAPIMTSP